MTIAGHAFTVKERAGDLISLRIALQGSLISELALKLSGLSGVRVTKGPEGMGRRRTFIAQCPGFKVILSADETADAVMALVSPVADDVRAAPVSELRVLLTGLMKPPAPPPPSEAKPSWREGFTFGTKSHSHDSQPGVALKASPLRRTALAPGKPLARKTLLTRRTPLGRGGRLRP
jgi:hypothetical protein